MADTYLERESKLDVPDGFTVPDLSDLVPAGGILETAGLHLDSRYFDTAERDLLSSRVTLRRREGGDTDTGWQLKLPTGADRTEVRLPPTTATTVPKELRDLTAGLRRGRALRPLARVQVERTAHRIVDAGGSVLVEIADDRVHGTTLGAHTVVSTWREVEVELGAGDRGLQRRIEKRLIRAGARPSASSSKLARTVDEPSTTTSPPSRRRRPGAPNVGDLVLDYLREQRQALLDGDVELRGGSDAIHQTRVASRRFRSTLRTYGTVFDDAKRRRTSRPNCAGTPQCSVPSATPTCCASISTASSTTCPSRSCWARWRAGSTRTSSASGERHRAALLRTLNGRRYFALLDAIDRWLDDPPFTALAGKPAARAGRLADRAQRKLAKRLAWSPSTTTTPRACTARARRPSGPATRWNSPPPRCRPSTPSAGSRS